MIKNIKENFDEKPKFINKMCKIPNMDVNPIIKMFDHLKEIIQKADDLGLRSLN